MKSNIDIFESDGDDEESEEQEQSENGHEGDDEEENEDEDNKKIKIKKKNKTSTKKKDIIDINEDLEEEQDNQKKTNNILYGILILGLPYETTELELKNLFSKYGQIVKIYLPKYKNTQKNIGHCYIYFEKEESLKKRNLPKNL